jgi:hypothetical protein
MTQREELEAAVGETLKPMLGMVSASGDVITCVAGIICYSDIYDSSTGRDHTRHHAKWFTEFGPDFDEPATLGCLIAQVRALAGIPVVAVCMQRRWSLHNMPLLRGMRTNGPPPRYESEVEAYLAAYLEVRP